MGKSVLLREIIKSLWKKFRKVDDAVAITTSTSIAMYNVGGVTLHSFGGFGLGIDTAEHLVNKIRGNVKVRMCWLRTQVSIIDEGGLFLSLQGGILTEDPCVSMVEGDLFSTSWHPLRVSCARTLSHSMEFHSLLQATFSSSPLSPREARSRPLLRPSYGMSASDASSIS